MDHPQLVQRLCKFRWDLVQLWIGADIVSIESIFSKSHQRVQVLHWILIGQLIEGTQL
jgi:hypothetical protein